MQVLGQYTVHQNYAAPISVFPNPATMFLSLELTDENPADQVFVYDNTGARVFIFNGADLKEGNKINVSALPEGFYMGVAKLQDKQIRSFKFGILPH